MRTAIFLIPAFLLMILWGCSEEKSPFPSVSHPQEWSEPSSDLFHGNKVNAAGNESCESCHGTDFQGGTSGVSCYSAQCHSSYPHPDQWTVPKHPQSHDTFIKNAAWSLENCQGCHGTDYRGGSSGESCYDCHGQTGGPEACNTCHGNSAGSVSMISNWAPPADLDGNVSTSAVGVGAHQKHVVDTTWSSNFTQSCSSCHRRLMGFDDPNHIKGGVELEFAEISEHEGLEEPLWNPDQATCQNMYCHGNFRFRESESNNTFAYADSVMVGNDLSIIWNQVNSGQADCGTCHGLPPEGHIGAESCDGCHGEVVDANNNIIDREKHMNGLRNVFGQEY